MSDESNNLISKIRFESKSHNNNIVYIVPIAFKNDNMKLKECALGNINNLHFLFGCLKSKKIFGQIRIAKQLFT